MELSKEHYYSQNNDKNSVGSMQPGAVNVFVCEAAGSRPAAKVFWRWENIKRRPLDWYEHLAKRLEMACRDEE